MPEVVVDQILSRLTRLKEQIHPESELVDKLRSLKKAFEIIQKCLNDAKRKSAGNSCVDAWIANVRCLAYEIDDLIDEYLCTGKETQPIIPILLKFHFDFHLCARLFSTLKNLIDNITLSRRLTRISRKVGEIQRQTSKLKLEQDAHERVGQYQQISTSIPLSADVVGRAHDVEQLEKWLLEEKQELATIGILGEEGIGKTTIAQRVYDSIKKHFDCYAWLSASKSSTETEILRDLMTGLYESQSVINLNPVDAMDKAAMRKQILHYLKGKNYLLVLDDMWDESTWIWVKHSLPDACSGKVILMTRNPELPHKVPECESFHSLKPLTEEDAHNLFYMRAFPNSDHENACPPLKQIGEAIIRICNGVPLAITTVSGLLSTKDRIPSEWTNVLYKLERDHFVSLSYTDLPPVLKGCFLYCSMFPLHYEIPCKKLIRLWVAEGFVQEIRGKTEEEAADHQLRQLIQRNMIVVARVVTDGEVESCRLPRPMHSFSLCASIEDRFCTNGKGTPFWTESRRFSVHGNTKITAPDNHSLHRLRSLLYFGANRYHNLTIANLISRFKLLRVLELQGLQIEILPETVGNLVHLRYLGLRGTGLKKLPMSLVRLNDLQTLDIRQTNMRVLPHHLNFLRRLRHLHLAHSCVNSVVTLLGDINLLTDLQTLAGAKITGLLAQQLRYLRQLQKLSIGEVKGEYSAKLCTSINNMTLLHSLTIKCKEGEQFDIQTLTPSTNLKKLRIGGQVNKLLDWVRQLTSLSYLYLWDCKLTQDPLMALQDLPNLTLLSLCNAYEGKQMSCNEGGYPHLKKLSILCLKELNEWERIDGAMRNLQMLFIGYCPKLTTPPKGLKELTTLQEVQVKKMPAGFEEMVW